MDNLKKIITIGTLKGGVGKTSVVFNIGGLLAEKGNKVLIIDLDPQANSTANFGILDSPTNTASSIFLTQLDPMTIVQKNKIKGLEGFDIIPSSIKLTETEMQLISAPGREKIMLNYIKNHYEWFSEYDYIIIDTNPSMSVINQNAFVVADEILLVTEPASNSYTGIEVFSTLWAKIAEAIGMENNIKGIIVNRVEIREKTSKDFIDFVKSADSSINQIVFDTYIPKNVSIKDANELGNIPINMHDKKSSGYIAYAELLDEMIKREVL